MVNNYNGRVGYIKDEFIEGRVTVSSSGKLISTGGKNIEKSKEQLLRTKSILLENKFINDVALEPKIRNIVVTYDFNKYIDIHDLIKK